MRTTYNSVSVIKLPRNADRLFGYQSNQNNRRFVLYFDPISETSSGDMGIHHNVFDVLLEAHENTLSDLQKFKLNKVLKRLERTHQNRFRRNSDWLTVDELEDYDNPWRIADYFLDTGANAEGVKNIINNQRIQSVFDSYYGLGRGCFRALFFSGDVMLMFDRGASELHIGGSDLLDYIELDTSKADVLESNDDPSNEIIARQLNDALMCNQILTENFFPHKLQ